VAAVRRPAGRRYGLGVGCRWECATSQGLPIGKHNTARKRRDERKPAASTWSRMQNNNICDCGELTLTYCTRRGKETRLDWKSQASGPDLAIQFAPAVRARACNFHLRRCDVIRLPFSHMLITPPAHSHKYLPCCCSSIPDSPHAQINPILTSSTPSHPSTHPPYPCLEDS
jgi:hypothetical protein